MSRSSRSVTRSSRAALCYYAAAVCFGLSIFASSSSSFPLPDPRHHPSRPPTHANIVFRRSTPEPRPSPTSPDSRPIIIAVPSMTVDLFCPIADSQFCSFAADALRSAATRLTSAVNLSTTARVRVSFFSKCAGSTCPDTLAATVPSRSLTVWVPTPGHPDSISGSNPRPKLTEVSLAPDPPTRLARSALSNDEDKDPTNLLPIPPRHPRVQRLQSDTPSKRTAQPGRLIEYPQLVLRNLATIQQSQLLANSAALLDHDYDVHMRLSADQHWWFPPAAGGRHRHASHRPPVGIRPDQFDMSLVVLHELVHGLGFGGVNLMQAGNNVSMVLPIAELGPHSVSPASSDSPQEVVRFRSPSVFESQLATVSTADPAAPPRLSELAYSITAAVEDSVHLPASLDQVNQALGYLDVLQSASTLYSLATTPCTIVISPASAPDAAASPAHLVLETALKPLSPGSSLTHISHAKYSASPEFLMTYQIPRGKTLDQLIAAHGALECGLGPQTLDAIRSLGFRINSTVAQTARLMAHEPPRLADGAYVLDRVVVSNLDAQFVPLSPGSAGPRVPAGSGMAESRAAGIETHCLRRWWWLAVAAQPLLQFYW